MKIVKVLLAILPVLTQLLKDLQDGKISAEERDALIVAAGLKVAEVVGIILAPAEPKEEPQA